MLNNYSTNVDESFRDCSKRYQKSLKISLNQVKKIPTTECFIQFPKGGWPISVELVHIARYTDADFPEKWGTPQTRCIDM